MMKALHQDLCRIIQGEVYTDPVQREVYATSACLYRVVPQAVVCPRNAEEVAAVVSFARERGIPLAAVVAGGYARHTADVVDIHLATCRVLRELWQ